MRPKLTLAAGALCLLASIVVHVGAQGAPPATPDPGGQGAGRGGRGAGRGAGAGNAQSYPAQQRKLADPAELERGKALYGVNCNGCHGPDLRGGDMGGPNLLRSDVVLADQNGELILPIVHGSRQQQGMDPINIPDADVTAIAAYIHSVAATMRGQGNPPPGGEVRLNIVVGNAAAGQAYFQAKCSACHSITGDLKGIATRVPDPVALQNLWVSGSGSGRGGRGGAEAQPVTVAVTLPNGQKMEGRLGRIDDFIVTMTDANGLPHSFRRDGDVPKVEIHDPLAPHRNLLTTYTDKDIHDVTAYLVTLK